MALSKDSVKEIVTFARGVMAREALPLPEAEEKLKAVALALSDAPAGDSEDDKTVAEIAKALGAGLADLDQSQGLQR